MPFVLTASTLWHFDVWPGLQQERTLTARVLCCHRHSLSLADCDPQTAPGGSEDTQDALPEDQGMERTLLTLDQIFDFRKRQRVNPLSELPLELNELPEDNTGVKQLDMLEFVQSL